MKEHEEMRRFIHLNPPGSALPATMLLLGAPFSVCLPWSGDIEMGLLEDEGDPDPGLRLALAMDALAPADLTMYG